MASSPRKAPSGANNALLHMTQEKLEHMVQECARKAVSDVLLIIGVDATNPIKAQATFAALREIAEMHSDPEFRSDLLELRAWRQSMSSMKRHGMLVAVGLVVAGVLAMIWQNIKQ